MAASRDRVSSSSSSEDDKEIQRLKEAAWSFTESNGIHDTVIPGGDSKEQPSRRINVSQHEHDGNELQTTPEFRTHVAKKLGSMLDSYISDGTSAEFQRTPRLDHEEEDDDDDDGFRLFSTSVPGEENLKPPALRCPVPSSSDSDSEMEMRLREAAVSVVDFLPAPALPSMPQPSFSPPIPTENQSRMKKRKKKKKKKARNGSEAEEERQLVEESSIHIRMGMQVDREGEAHDHGRNTADTQGALKAALNVESTLPQDEIPAKKKKKKKKMRSEVEG